MKCEIERERENIITTYLPYLLNKRGKDDLTIVIHQLPNEADIIIHSAPVIERHIHKRISMKNLSLQVPISQKETKKNDSCTWNIARETESAAV